MKVLAISDLHGDLPSPPAESYDLFVLAGDYEPDGGGTTEWWNTRFVPWLNTIKADLRLVMPGNHDTWTGENYAHRNYLPIINYSSLLIMGYSYKHRKSYIHCEPFTACVDGPRYQSDGWAYGTANDDALKPYWDLIPYYTNLLVTHCPPAYILDKEGGRNFGSLSLRKHLSKLRSLRVHIFGHVHAAAGMQEVEFENGQVVRFYNVARRWTELTA